MNRLLIENSNIVLRKIFNNEENLDIVKDFIESILDIKIKDLKVRPYLGEKSEYLPKEEKYGIVNVRVIDEEGKQLNVGIQFIDGFYMQEKLITYAISIHMNQNEYEDYNETVDTITINILDFKGFYTSAYHKVVSFLARNEEKYIEMKNDIVFHVLELPYFTQDDAQTPEEEWLIYLKGKNSDLLEKVKEKNKSINKLDKILKEYWRDENL